MSDLDLAQLRRLAEAATPGPWRFVPEGDLIVKREPDGGDQMIADTDWNADTVRVRGFGAGLPIDANGEFIAAMSPEVVLALIDLIEREGKT